MKQGSDLPRRFPGASRHIPGGESSLLLALQSMWDGKYLIHLDADCASAQRIGSTDVITADTIFELRELIRTDAMAWNREKYGSHL
jgi:hypothetical protein